MEIQHNIAKNRYELHQQGEIAVADYIIQNGKMIITHVGVPEALENQGIGSALVKQALQDARAKGFLVHPLCSFAAAYIKRHTEYADLVSS